MIELFFASLMFVDGGFDIRCQEHAKREALLMADRKVCEHLLGPGPNAKFSGVGVSNRPNPKVCLPWEHGSKAKTIIADATVERNGWFYRSVHWK